MDKVVTNQPGGQGLLIGSVEGHREWSTGLFDCFSDISSLQELSTHWLYSQYHVHLTAATIVAFTFLLILMRSLMGFFCLPCTLCNISSRQGDCLLMPCCVQGSALVLRTRIRTLGGIRGTVCNDCMVTACCGACAVCQMQRELDNMGL